MAGRPAFVCCEFRENLVHGDMPKVKIRREFTCGLLRWFIPRLSISRQLILQKRAQQCLSRCATSSGLHRGNLVIQGNSCKHSLSRIQQSSRSFWPALGYLPGKRFWFRKLCVQQCIGFWKFHQMWREFLLQEPAKRICGWIG